MLSLRLDETLQEGSDVLLGVKATAVSLAIDESALLSVVNQLPVTVKGYEKGEILSSVQLIFEDVAFESIITTRSLIHLDIKEGDHLKALIKASDLSIVGEL